MKKTKVLVVLVDRANYGRMRMVMSAIQEHDLLELQTLCAGSMVLERFGRTSDEVVQDGFHVNLKIFMELEGSQPISMAKSLGVGVIEFASAYQQLAPDIVLLIGDRYEALAAALASVYMNIPVAHIQGGEVSGSIDESARHAISKLAQWHFPSTRRAAEYLYLMGEPRENIFLVGCPVGDYILRLKTPLTSDAFRAGSGAEISPMQPFNLVIYHPVTTRFGDEQDEMIEVLTALNELQMPTVMLWPNIDAGADHISKSLRVFRDRLHPSWLRFITNLHPVQFQATLKQCSVAIGNSSSFVRDSTFTGTPVVLIGDRQFGRETGKNAITVSVNRAEIVAAVRQQIVHGRYPPDTLYGDGMVSARIADVLAHVKPFIQKRLDYINR